MNVVSIKQTAAKMTLALIAGALISLTLSSCGTTGSAAKSGAASGPAPLASFAGTAGRVAEGEAGTTPTVFIIGDSTACDYTASKAPRMGWGQVFAAQLGANVKLVNAARSGAGTRTFLYEALFIAVEVEMKKGDFLIIQFGHNDAKAGDPRFAEANGEYIDNLVKFIETAREYGVTSIVLSPIERRNYTTTSGSHGEYPAAAAKAAAKTGMGFINMTYKTAALFSAAGDEGSKKLFLHLAAGASPNYPQGIADDTHLQEAGAIEVARLVAEGLKEIDSPLVNYLKKP